ncbi:MAG: Glutamyl-tRNA reductase [Verrucomicrobiota bacterium]
MEILCLGLNHRTAPVELRERFAVPEGDMGSLAAELGRQAGVSEGVVVSTCNRVEFYLAAEDPEVGFASLQSYLRTRGLEVEGDAFFRHSGKEGIRHLFRVSAGLDSMVLGETEILGQVKKAYLAAQEAKATARHLNKLFQRAFNVAKEVRTKTNITRGSVSVGSAAVELAERIFGKLSQCTVMILGAGEMSELTAGALQARGVKAIFVANRSYDRAVALAEKMGGKAVHFDAWAQEFAEVDILIGSTAAPHHVLTRAQLEPIMDLRPARPLFCIDLAVPRDIEPTVDRLDGVYLYDIDSLQAIADQSLQVRRQELGICEQMIDRHVGEFFAWLSAGDSGGNPERASSRRNAPPQGGEAAHGA